MAPDRRGSSGAGHGYLIEFVQMGNFTKASAIDPTTGIEVSIVGPTNAGQAILTHNVIAKLKHRIAQREPGRG
jgi:Domain of unknown function (DUF6898)